MRSRLSWVAFNGRRWIAIWTSSTSSCATTRRCRSCIVYSRPGRAAHSKVSRAALLRFSRSAFEPTFAERGATRAWPRPYSSIKTVGAGGSNGTEFLAMSSGLTSGKSSCPVRRANTVDKPTEAGRGVSSRGFSSVSPGPRARRPTSWLIGSRREVKQSTSARICEPSSSVSSCRFGRTLSTYTARGSRLSRICRWTASLDRCRPLREVRLGAGGDRVHRVYRSRSDGSHRWLSPLRSIFAREARGSPADLRVLNRRRRPRGPAEGRADDPRRPDAR